MCTYIEQTNKRINVGKLERVNAVLSEKITSSLAHVKTTSHYFEWTQVLANLEYRTKGVITETIEIEKRLDNLNTQYDNQRISTTWKSDLSNPENTREDNIPYGTLKTNSEPIVRMRARSQQTVTDELIYKQGSKSEGLNQVWEPTLIRDSVEMSSIQDPRERKPVNIYNSHRTTLADWLLKLWGNKRLKIVC